MGTSVLRRYDLRPRPDRPPFLGDSPMPMIHRSTRSPALAFILFLALVSTLTIANPASADPIETFNTSGNQQENRWQVFDLDLPDDAVDVVTHWDGTGDVNIFLKDANGNTLASGNSTSQRPEYIMYDGNTRPAKLAVLVKSGSATNIRANLHDYGTAPWLVSNGYHDDTPPPPNTDNPPPPPPPEPDDPPPSTADGRAYPGQPAPGTVLWGASLDGNQDPYERHERAAGATMGVRRTFFAWSQRTGSLINIARDDARDGRVSWVSVKTPSWREMANGRHDGAIDEMLRAMDAIDNPIWLTLHHEPEGGHGSNSADDPGGPGAHVDMNRRVRQRMNALGVDNIALAPILMAWTFNPRSGRNPNAWWEDGLYDFLGIDIYTGRETSLLFPNWYDVRRWAGNKGVDISVGEWAIRGDDQAAYNNIVDWHHDAAGSANDGRGAQVAGLAVFDNTKDDRRLRGKQLEAFRDMMRHRDSATP